MEKCFELQFLLLVCFFLRACRCQDNQFCPVVLEGSPFSYSCVAPVHYNYRFVIWELTDERSAKTSEITRCSVHSSDCDSNFKQFSVRNEYVSSKEYTSTIQTSSATFDDRFFRLTCRYTDLNSAPVLVTSCKMAVYRDGNSVNCTSRLQQDGAIYLICTIAYPGISCYYYERINLGSLRQGNMSGKTKPSKDSTLASPFEYSCTKLIYPPIMGIYKYDFFVEFGKEYLKLKSANTELDIRAKPRVTVGVSPDRAPLCQRRTDVEVKCNVTFMKVAQPPKFRFLMGTKEINNMRMRSFNQGQTEFTTYEAVGNVEVTEKDNKVLMLCLVNYTDGNDMVSLNDTKYLKLLLPPPEPPKLTGDGGLDVPLGETLEIKKGSSSLVTCSVKGGEPQVSSIDITCKTESHVVFNNRSHTGSVSATIQGNSTYNGTICVCSALHESNCYNFTTGIPIKVLRLGVATPAPRKLQETANVAYIIAGAVSLVVVVVVVAVSYMICCHGDSLYSSNNVYTNHIHPLRRCCCCRKSYCPPAESNVAPELPPPRIKPRLVPRSAAPIVASPPPPIVDRSSAREWKDDPDLNIVNNGEGPCVIYKARDNTKGSRMSLNATGISSVHSSKRLEQNPHAEYLSLLPPETNEPLPHLPLTSTGYIPMLPPLRTESQHLLGAREQPTAPTLSTESYWETQDVGPPFRVRPVEPCSKDNSRFSSLGFQSPMVCGRPSKSREPVNGARTRRLTCPSAPNHGCSSTDKEEDSIRGE